MITRGIDIWKYHSRFLEDIDSNHEKTTWNLSCTFTSIARFNGICIST